MSIRETFEVAAGEVVQALADTATYNGTEGIPVVWGSDFQSVQGGELRISSRRPELYVRYIDMPEDPVTGDPAVAAKGDEVEVRGVLYEVATVRPDTEDVGTYLTLKTAS